MKKIYFSILLLITIISNVTAQLNYQWALNPKNIDTLGGNVIGKTIKVDASGNTYVVGFFQGTADFDPGSGISILTSLGDFDIFIAKYDALGNYIFAKNIGGIGSSLGSVSGMSIASDGNGDVSGYLDNNGNIYITGAFYGTIDFDPGVGIANLSCIASYETNSFLAKYDASGNYIFAKSIGSANGYTISNAITVDALGNSYLTGYLYGTADFDPGVGVANLTATPGPSNGDIFIAKYNAIGNYVSAICIGGSAGDLGKSIAIDGSNNIYVTGTFMGPVDFDPSAGIANLNSSGIFIAKYNSALGLIYAKDIAGYCTVTSIAIDGNHNAYVTGYLYGTVDFDPSSSIVNLASNGNDDIFIAKYDAVGNYIYAKSIGGLNSDRSNSIVVDNSGSISITGFFKGNCDFDPGVGSANLTSLDSAIFIAKYDASGNYMFAKSIDATGFDQGNSIAINNSGNTYITGVFSNTADFDPSSSTTILTAASMTLNAFVGKYDINGNYMWAKALGGYANIIYNEQGKGITHDLVGNVYVTGYYSGIVDFDPSNGIANLASVGNNDIFLAKYDASGNYVFAKSIGGNSIEQGNAISIDNVGNIYITGTFKGTVDFDPSSATANFTSTGISNIFIAKYDATGNYIFANTIGGTGSNQSLSMAIDDNNDTFITGIFSGTADFDPGVGILNLTTAGASASFLAKYNASGNNIFAIKIEGTSIVQSNSLTIDSHGNSFITGNFRNTTDFDPGAGLANLVSAGLSDVFFAKYDSLGNYIYAKRIGGTGNEIGTSIAVDGNDNAYITGSFYGTADFDPNAGIVNLTSVGASDVFIARYDSIGNYVFAERIGGANSDQGSSIVLDANNNIYLSGYFQGIVDFDPGAAIANLTSNGGNDIFLMRCDSNGNYIEGNAMGGTGNDLGSSIDIDALGNQYVTGAFTNIVDFDPNIGVANLQSFNSQDIFVAKYSGTTNSVADFSISIPSISIYPNPYSNTTQINYILNNTAYVNIDVYDVIGQKIAKIISSNQSSGEYKYQFSAKERGFPSGVYFVKMSFDEKVVMKKIIEIK
ncbi:MAG: hypothetical protein A3F72_04330 [Bacteroidetes bacterium RIFCSPLOWO2_12_FULL_35_15]|nr:MAG: hypothetical protein A3F72_04330 [Bacteroidetes bacterium RIFCSPLOWO2_12_FULL_35_15]